MDNPIPALNPAEVRVLGALVEKQLTTPDYYPLTLNALLNACNQLTNREPVVAFDESTVTRAIEDLREKRLAGQFQGAESRVAKYKHALTDALLLTPAEVALLCVLLLRGPQTIGELRTRAERMFAFETLAEVGEVLAALASHQPQALVAKLPRQPGTKEARYAHLLGGPIASAAIEPTVQAHSASAVASPEAERVDRLETEVAALRREVAELKEQLATFRRQLE